MILGPGFCQSAVYFFGVRDDVIIVQMGKRNDNNNKKSLISVFYIITVVM